jgi:TrmH family RNA methyltransferase
MVIEGLRLVREAAAAPCEITWGFYTPEFIADARGQALIDRMRAHDVALWRVTDEVMAALSDTETPQGIVAVLPMPALPIPEGPGLSLLADGIRDPGNLGTMLRTAWAAGVRRVLLPPGNVDVTNPKVVRAGMGAHFALPIRTLSWDAVPAAVAGETLWLAEVAGGFPYDEVDWTGLVTLIIGGEAHGAGPRARALAKGRHVYISMAPGVESLNAAMATAILLFEARRQRLRAGRTVE